MAVTMNFRWDDVGTLIPVGQAKYVVNEQPIAEYDNWAMYTLAADMQAVIDDVINKFNANTILKADTDNTPVALAVAEQTIVGRKTGSSIAALTAAEVRSILNVEDAADVTDSTNVNTAGAVMESDFNATTFLYATSDNVPQPKTPSDVRGILNVEDGAAADQTNNEIRDAVEAATDSNTFTDADHTKLNGIATGAEVNLFEEVTNVLREKSAGGHDNDFVIGSPQLADDGNTAHDYRMWFDKSKGSFRTGRCTGTAWDDASVGDYSFACGRDTIASGSYGAVAEGRSSEAIASYSHSGGFETKAYLYGQHARGSGNFSVMGDAQYSTVTARTDTASTGQVIMYLDDVVNEKAIVPANRTWAFTINIAARQTAGAGTIGDSGIYKIEGGIKRDGANNTALVGVITKTVLAEDQSAWDVTAEADDTNECLVIKVTGEASKTIHWVAKVDLVEVG